MQKPKKHLYLLALLPPEEIRRQVRGLKQEMKDRFGASHTLKSPAHITLQKPFRMPETDLPSLARNLSGLAESLPSFDLHCQRFGSFPPRVIYLDVRPHEPIFNLHDRLIRTLEKSGHPPPDQLMRKIHPHMTIATRDLDPENFRAAWQEFRNRSFDSSFRIRFLTLLRHNGARWTIDREFPFADSHEPSEKKSPA